MGPVPVLQVTASPIEMKLAVKVSQYLFSPVKVLRKACIRFDKCFLKKTVFFFVVVNSSILEELDQSCNQKCALSPLVTSLVCKNGCIYTVKYCKSL